VKYNPENGTETEDEISRLSNYTLSERICNLTGKLHGYAVDPVASATLRDSMGDWEAKRTNNLTRYRFSGWQFYRQCETLERAVSEAWLDWQTNEYYRCGCQTTMRQVWDNPKRNWVLECPDCGARKDCKND
jgi:hypothetical protein